MKKITLIIAAIVVAFAAKANDMWVGGGIGVSVDGVVNGNTNVGFTIAPEFGYNLTDKWAVAGELAYNYMGVAGGDINELLIGPYVRYTLIERSRISLFGEFGLHYLYEKVGKAGNSGVDLVLRPGIAVKLNDDWSLTGKLDLLRYQHAGGDVVGFKLSTGLSVGFIYNF